MTKNDVYIEQVIYVHEMDIYVHEWTWMLMDIK